MQTVNTYHSAAAKLVEQYPYDVPAIVDFIRCRIERVKAKEAKTRKKWKLRFFTANDWFYYVDSIAEVINKGGDGYNPTPKKFVDAFFFGDKAYFSADCLLRYAEQPDCNPEVSQFIQIVFK